MKHLMTSVMAIVVLGALGACPAPAPPVATPPGNASTTPPPPDQAAATCSTDTDCVVVETACCDHCNGGKAEAFPKALAASHAPQCKETMCTQMACGPATAHCTSGRCTVSIGSL